MSATGRGGQRIELDAYYTPDHVAAACASRLDLRGVRVALEPSAGGGAFVRAAKAGGVERVLAMDVNPMAPSVQAGADADAVHAGDFLDDYPAHFARPNLIIGNPPYRDAEAHVRRALQIVEPGGLVVFLLRVGFLSSRRRAALWQDHPARLVYVLTLRPSFTGGGTDASEYALFVWEPGFTGRPEIDWILPDVLCPPSDQGSPGRRGPVDPAVGIVGGGR